MEMATLQEYSKELIATGVLLFLLLFFRVVTSKLVRSYAKNNQTLEHRTNLVVKYIHLLLYMLAAIALIIIWGVKPQDILWAFSSITTVVGVALIAQWSILSNITSGIIMFFSFPFKIGDVIKIHDKDFPIIGEIKYEYKFLIDFLKITKECLFSIYEDLLNFSSVKYLYYN